MSISRRLLNRIKSVMMVHLPSSSSLFFIVFGESFFVSEKLFAVSTYWMWCLQYVIASYCHFWFVSTDIRNQRHIVKLSQYFISIAFSEYATLSYTDLIHLQLPRESWNDLIDWNDRIDGLSKECFILNFRKIETRSAICTAIVNNTSCSVTLPNE